MSLWLVEFQSMRDLFILVTYLLATVARLMRPGGVRAVAAESLLLKHQLLILNRPRKRALHLATWDRRLLGFGALFVHPKRVHKLAVALKPSTFRRVLAKHYQPEHGNDGPSWLDSVKQDVRCNDNHLGRSAGMIVVG
jgi:hypothetical protein